MNNIIVATTRPWHANIVDKLNRKLYNQFVLINRVEQLNRDNLNKYQPKYVFFPHWSHIIEKDVYQNLNCVIFHMTDLPFGRGGSPLQNLIVQGFTETKISAIRCVEELDAGPVYLKKTLSLLGTAEEIFIRASILIEDMIVEIIEKNIQPVPQEGNPTHFKRRKPAESDIAEISSLELIYDHIRMLDADGYPKAFIETKHFRFEFSRASFKSDGIIADVRITKK